MRDAQDKYEFRVTWHPFFLRPNIPPEGIPKQGNRVGGHLKAAGEAVGIDFTGKCPVYPSTLKAHVLLDLVKDDLSVQDKLSEALFKAYFTDGSMLDDASLLSLAESAGLDKSKAEEALNDKQRQQDVYEKAIGWSNRGVNGVPYFYMNDQKTFSGAQDSSAFVRMFEIISEKFPANY